MRVLILNRKPRDGGMVDVTLSQDGTRFTVSVPSILDASEDAEVVYQQMANSVVREADLLHSIVDANKGV